MTLKLLSQLWTLGLLCSFLWVLKKKFKFDGIRHPLVWVIVISLLVRIIPAFILQTGSNYDIDSFQMVANNVRNFEDVYSAEDTVDRHPYLPFQLYWIGLAGWLADKTSLAFSSVVRLAPIIADSFIILLLFKMISKNKTLDPIHAAMLYAINPISVYVSSYHGQFDSIPLLFLLLSIFFIGSSAKKSGFWLGLGIWIKSWPVLLLPIIFSTFQQFKEKIRFIIALISVPILGILIYIFVFQAEFFNVVGKALGYNHGVGVWGYTYFLKLIKQASFVNLDLWAIFNYLKYLTLVIIFLVWYFVARKQRPIHAILTIILTFIAFTHAFSIQYLAWIIPFGILYNRTDWIKRFTMAGFAYMFIAYHTLILDFTITNIISWPLADTLLIIPASIPVWLVSLFWFFETINFKSFHRRTIS